MSTASSSRILSNAEPAAPTLPDVSGVKHALSDTEDDEAPHPKRLRNLGAEASRDSLNSTKDRKKRPKKRKRKVPVVQSTSGPSSPTRERERESVMPVVSLSRPSSVAPLAETNVNTSMRQRTTINLRVPSEGPTASGFKIPRNVRPEQDDSVIIMDNNDDSVIIMGTSEEKNRQPTPGPSNSPNKGKNKAIDDLPPDSTSIYQVSVDQHSNSTVPVNQLLSQHTALLAAITQSMTCQICLDGLRKPYALAPCGHVACRGCLVSWFSAPAPNAADDDRPIWLRPKTCPHCRARVLAKPAEVWVLKEIATAIMRSGLAPEPLATPPPAAVADERADQDPWAAIFDGPARGHQGRGGDAENQGVLDDEDNVWRCVDCFHEIMGGVCTGCERHYAGHLDVDSDDDEAAQVALYGGAPLAAHHWWGGIAPQHEPLLDERFNIGGGGYRPWWARVRNGNEDDEDGDDLSDLSEGSGDEDRNHGREWARYAPIQIADSDDEYGAGYVPPAPPNGVIDITDEEDGSYEGSFIDDEEQVEEGEANVHEIFGSDDEDDDGPLIFNSDDGGLPVPIQRRGRPPPHIIASDDDEEDEVEVVDGPARRQRRQNIIINSDSEDENEGALYFGQAPLHNHAQREAAARAVDEGMDQLNFFDEDLYDSDDEVVYDGNIPHHGFHADEYGEDGESDEEEDANGHWDEDDQEEEEDGSINRIPMNLARQLGRGARY